MANKLINIGESHGGYSQNLTPATEEEIRAFFEGLAAIHETCVFSRPADCGGDPRFAEVMANIWPIEYSSMKEYSKRDCEAQYDARPKAKKSLIARLMRWI